MRRLREAHIENPIPNYKDLHSNERLHPGTSWGVFGEFDQLGTLNHLTPQRVVDAALEIKLGERFNLNLSLNAFDPPLISHRGLIKHEVFGLNGYHRDDRVDSLYPQASTQIDSLRHFAHPDYGFYNGFPGEQIRTGTPELGIQNVAETGICGRGILIDVDFYRKKMGRPINHDASEQIGFVDLEAALEFQKTATKPGDILLLRFGWLEHYRSSSYGSTNSAGLAQSKETAEWLWDRQFSVVAADNIALEAWPPNRDALPTLAEQCGELQQSSHTGMLHRLLIPLLGLTIGELWDLDALAQRSREIDRYRSFISAEPLNLPGGVGSPANALAII